MRTCWEEMRVPPHQGWEPPADTRPTCQGYSLASVSTPPTILSDLLGTPQVQVVGDPVDGTVVLGEAVEGAAVEEREELWTSM